MPGIVSPRYIILLPCEPDRERVRRDDLRVPHVPLDERRGGRGQDGREHSEAEGADRLEHRDHVVARKS